VQEREQVIEEQGKRIEGLASALAALEHQGQEAGLDINQLIQELVSNNFKPPGQAADPAQPG
jgi:hypothetical protein